MKRKLKWKDALWGLFLVSVLSYFLVDPVWNRSFEEIQESGTLRVLTRNAPTTYFLDSTGKPTGPEFDLIHAFANHMGWKTEFITKSTTGELLDSLRSGNGDLIAAGLAKTDQRADNYEFGPEYQEVTQQVICRRGNAIPRTVSQLAGKKLLVVGGTSYVERLKSLKKIYKDLSWEESWDLETEQVLEKVWNREVDCTIADSTIVKINRRYFPELVIAFDMKKPEPLAWVLPRNAKSLRGEIQKWFDTFREAGGPKAVQARYYDFLPEFDYVNTRRFMKDINGRLPKFQHLFDKAAELYDLSPVILAAQAYQESKWDPKARSFTDVKGMMMLTRATAASMGIKNRLDVRKSVFGGALYLSKLKGKLRKVPEPDRTWMALAAYNVGLGHLRDAQKLARQKGKNPYKWDDLKTILPLLRNKKYFKNLKYGYARGLEPVRYVQRIREYSGILSRTLNAQASLFP